MKNGVYFILIALSVAELFKILIYPNKWTCDVTRWTQNDVKAQKMEYIWKLFLCRIFLYSCYTHHKFPWYVHCDISMATQLAPGPPHPKSNIWVSLLQVVLFASDVQWVGAGEYGNDTAQAQESLSDSGATNEAFLILGKSRSGNEYASMVTS